MSGDVNPGLIRFRGEEIVTDESEAEKAQRREAYRQRRTQLARLRARCSALYANGMYMTEIIETVNTDFELYDAPLEAADVRRYIDEQVRFWRKEGTKHIDDKKAMMLAKIDMIEEMATNAYFASMEGRSTYTYEKQLNSVKTQNEQDALRENGLPNSYETKQRKPLMNRVQDSFEDAWADVPIKSDDLRPTFTDGNLPNSLLVLNEKIKEFRRLETNKAGDPRWLKLMLDCIEKRAKLWGLYVKDAIADDDDRQFARMTDKERMGRVGNILEQVAGRVAAKQPALLASAGPLEKNITDLKQLAAEEQGRQLEAMERSTNTIDQLRARAEDLKHE